MDGFISYKKRTQSRFTPSAFASIVYLSTLEECYVFTWPGPIDVYLRFSLSGSIVMIFVNFIRLALAASRFSLTCVL